MAMRQVYDALWDLTDECVSVYPGNVLVYPSMVAAHCTHLWMVLEWLLELRLNAYAMVSNFLSVRCHCECVLDLDCGSRSLLPGAPGFLRSTHNVLYRRRWPAAPSLVKGMQQLVGRDAADSELHSNCCRVRFRVDGVGARSNGKPLVIYKF